MAFPSIPFCLAWFGCGQAGVGRGAGRGRRGRGTQEAVTCRLARGGCDAACARVIGCGEGACVPGVGHAAVADVQAGAVRLGHVVCAG